MQIVILAAFVVTLLLDGMLEPAGPVLAMTDTSGSLLLSSMAAYLLITGLWTHLLTANSVRAIGQAAPASSKRIRTHNLLQMLLQTYLVAGLAGLLALGMGAQIGRLLDSCILPIGAAGFPLSHVPGLQRAIELLPFLVALLLYWTLSYPLHRQTRTVTVALHEAAGVWQPPIWTRWQFLAYNVRHQFLFIAVPVGLIIFLNDSITMHVLPALPRMSEHAMEIVAVSAHALAAGGVFLIAPLLIVRVWQTRPLEAGPLREQLEGTMRSLALRCRDIRVWETAGVVTNAGVMGIIGPVRYVLLTDALLANMDPRHLQAIFAHEVGHIVSHHIFYASLFAVGTILLTASAAQALVTLGVLDDWTAQIASLAALAAIWMSGFSRLSRLFERQSDVIAAWSAGNETNFTGEPGRITPHGAAVFAGALNQVAQLNGIPANQPNWRHGTIEQRISHVLWLGSTGASRQTVDNQVRRVKWLLWAVAALGVAAATAVSIPY